MEPLFLNQFPAADKAAWRAQVQKDLKDPSAPDSLRWETDLPGRDNTITLEPYYTADDLATLPLADIQAAQRTSPGWLNAPERRITDPKQDNMAAQAELSRGADALVINLTNPSFTTTDLSRLLNGIKLSDTPVFFRLTDLPNAFIHTLQVVAPYQLKGGLLTDPLARWQQTGLPVDEAMAFIAEATGATANSPQFRTICASSQVYHNAGANATQELAFLLGSLADQYDGLTNTGLTVDHLAPKTILSLSVGTSYFVEIAKLRAVRVLWQRFLSAYDTLPIAPYIHAQTSTFYDAARSPYTNLLRATTETMSAVIGGCDVLTVHPYNAILEQAADPAEKEHAERIARNVSVLLTEESYLDKVADPSAGSYYIETLTQELVDGAWTLFLQVETQGGIRKAAEAGFVLAEIDKVYQARIDTLKNGRVMVGVNKFQADDIAAAANPAKPDYPVFTGLLPNRRLAEEFDINALSQ